MLHAFSPRNTKQLKISPGQSLTTLYCQNDRLGAPDRISEGSIASCCLLPTCCVLAKSVTVSVAMQKVRVVLRQAWSKSQLTVLMGYLTISTNVRRYQTHHRWQFFFRKTAHRCIVCVTQSNWVKMWFSCFPIFTGSAEAQVIWGGIIKRLLIAWFIRNISSKKDHYPFTCIKVIASQMWDVFWDTV